MLPSIKARFVEEVVKERNKYITKDAPSHDKGDGLVQATAATVGFFSEISHHRNEKKTEKRNADAERLEPDAAVAKKTPQEGIPDSGAIPKGMAAAFLHRHSPTISGLDSPSQSLKTPVLIPQRRPNTRARGFAPAYAPILNNFNIPQHAFLDFVITLNASLEPSPYLNAINLASFAGEASPEPLVGFLIGEAVEAVTDAVMEVQSRVKSNGFLDKANEGFFAPRGLLAFVGTWRPSKDKSGSTARLSVEEDASMRDGKVDVTHFTNSVVESETTAASDKWRLFQNQVQRAMFPAGGSFGTIVPAPLTWPSAEEIATVVSQISRKKQGRFDRAGLWIDEHVDKHSQVTWTKKHPDHPLADSLPEPEFRSRFANPSHAASSGDVVSLLTAGQWHTKEDEKKKEKEARRLLEKERKKEKKLQLKREKAKSKHDKLEAKTSAVGCDGSNANPDNQGTRVGQSECGTAKDAKKSSKERRVGKEPGSGLGSLLEKNLLYLVVVQHPSSTNA